MRHAGMRGDPPRVVPCRAVSEPRPVSGLRNRAVGLQIWEADSCQTGSCCRQWCVPVGAMANDPEEEEMAVPDGDVSAGGDDDQPEREKKAKSKSKTADECAALRP